MRSWLNIQMRIIPNGTRLKLRRCLPPMLRRWCMGGGSEMRTVIGIVQTATKLLLSAKVAENELIASRTAPTAARRWTEVQTMAEYIDRANLIARIKYYVTHTPEGSGEHYAYSVVLNEVLNRPAADVAPVVHGRWDDSGRYTFPNGDTAVVCPNCGCALTESEYHLNNWNYCPVCGDKMDGGADND